MAQKRPSLLFIIVAVSVVIAGLLLYRDYRATHIKPDHALLFPKLESQLDEFNHIAISYKKTTIHLDNDSHVWVVREANKKPADLAKLRNLMLTLATAEIKEKKTNDPERYASLGLDEEKAIHLTISNTSDAPPLVDMYIGYKMSPLNGTYIRLNNKPQTWLVSGDLTIPAESSAWVK